MTHLLQPTPKSFNDLVFDHRNKAYGAYILRRDYPFHVLLSLLLGVAIIASILAIPYLSSLWNKEVMKNTTETPPCIDCEYVIKPPPKQNPSGGGSSKPPTGPPTSQGGVPVVVNEGETEVKEAQGPAVKPGLITDVLEGWEGGTGPEGPEGPGSGGGGPEGKEGPPDDGGVHMSPEVWPQFPGGDDALFRYLTTHIQYPSLAKDIGIQGVVYLRFTIDQFGNVRDVTVERGIGGGCDEEAVRVISKMPRWKPGKQGGRAVKVSYILPVKFALQ